MSKIAAELLMWLLFACAALSFIIGRGFARETIEAMSRSTHAKAELILDRYNKRQELLVYICVAADIIITFLVVPNLPDWIGMAYRAVWWCALFLFFGSLQKRRMAEELERAKRMNAFRKDDEP